jgi:uncharacterized metal-binding protein YceD (DUF177 family)
MKMFKDYDVSFIGLKDGTHYFEYKIEKSFFEAFDFDEFLDTNLLVELNLIKKNTMLELKFSTNGTIQVSCDITNEPYDETLVGELNIVVKFGEEYNDDNDEILIIPHGQHQVNIAQFIYEMIVLSVPKKKIHPGIIDGTLKSDILEKLEELKPKEKKNLNKIDPRWDDLKKLLTDKNK